MSTALDMSLDDMIKKSNSQRTRGQGQMRRGRGPRGPFNGGRMNGMFRRGPLRVNTARPSPYAIAKSIRRPRTFPWRRDLFEDGLNAAGLPGIENGTKLYVSNLDQGVTNDDIRELFSEIGELKRYAVHYDRHGRPSGSAEVVFVRRSDAFAALKRYNNVQLDGKLMKIEIVGANTEMPVSARVNVVGGANGRRTRTVVMTPAAGLANGTSPAINRVSGRRNRVGPRSGQGAAPGRGQVQGQGQGQSQSQSQGRVRGRGRGGRGRNKPMDKSADELDMELEKYHEAANVH